MVLKVRQINFAELWSDVYRFMENHESPMVTQSDSDLNLKNKIYYDEVTRSESDMHDLIIRDSLKNLYGKELGTS